MSARLRKDDLTLRERLRVTFEVARAFPRTVVNHYRWKIARNLEERRKPNCPRCGRKLATVKAQQCLGCSLHWHGKPMPEKRSSEFVAWRKSQPKAGRKRASWGKGLGLPWLIANSVERTVWRVKQDRWRESDAWAAAGVGPADVLVLKRLLKSNGYEEPIIGIQRTDDDRISISTGWQADPLMGRGTDVWVEHGDSGWFIESDCGWVS